MHQDAIEAIPIPIKQQLIKATIKAEIIKFNVTSSQKRNLLILLPRKALHVDISLSSMPL